jgi:hypothetical protein
MQYVQSSSRLTTQQRTTLIPRSNYKHSTNEHYFNLTTSKIIAFPLLNLPPMSLPIQPTTHINPNISRVISSLHSHLRRRLSPHPSLTVEDHLRRLALTLRRIRLREPEPGLEFIRREIQRITLRCKRDADCRRDNTRAFEFGGLAHVDEDYGLVGRAWC